MKKAEILANFMRDKVEWDLRTESHAVGGGEWSLEVYGESDGRKEYLFELVGSNGTHPDYPADDLHEELEMIVGEAKKYRVNLEGYDAASIMRNYLEAFPEAKFESCHTESSFYGLGDLRLYVYIDGDPIKWFTNSGGNRLLLLWIEHPSAEMINEVDSLVEKFPNTNNDWENFYGRIN